MLPQGIHAEAKEYMQSAVMVALQLDGLPVDEITPAMIIKFMGDEYSDEVERLFHYITNAQSSTAITPQALVQFMQNAALKNPMFMLACVMQGFKTGSTALMQASCSEEIYSRYQTLTKSLIDSVVRLVLKLALITESLALPEPEDVGLTAQAFLDSMIIIATDFAEDCAEGVPSLAYATALQNPTGLQFSSASKMLGKFTSLMEGFSLDDLVSEAKELRREAAEYSHNIERELTTLAADSTLMLPASPTKGKSMGFQTLSRGKLGTAPYTGAKQTIEMNVRRQGKLMAHMCNEHASSQRALASVAGLLKRHFGTGDFNCAEMKHRMDHAQLQRSTSAPPFQITQKAKRRGVVVKGVVV